MYNKIPTDVSIFFVLFWARKKEALGKEIFWSVNFNMDDW